MDKNQYKLNPDEQKKEIEKSIDGRKFRKNNVIGICPKKYYSYVQHFTI